MSYHHYHLSWRRLKEHPQTCPQHPVWCRVNVGCGPAEQRLLLTGLHSVADIFCENCKTTLGWKYVSAPAPPTWDWASHWHPNPLAWASQRHNTGTLSPRHRKSRLVTQSPAAAHCAGTPNPQ